MGASHLSGRLSPNSRVRDSGIFEKEREPFVTCIEVFEGFQGRGPHWEGDLIWPYRFSIVSKLQKET